MLNSIFKDKFFLKVGSNFAILAGLAFLAFSKEPEWLYMLLFFLMHLLVGSYVVIGIILLLVSFIFNSEVSSYVSKDKPFDEKSWASFFKIKFSNMFVFNRICDCLEIILIYMAGFYVVGAFAVVGLLMCWWGLHLIMSTQKKFMVAKLSKE